MGSKRTPLTPDRQRLVLSHLDVARRMAKRYARPGRPLGFDDLYMEGIAGLIHAAETFDTSRAVAFTTFAYPFVWRSVLHAIRREVRLGLGVHNHVQQRQSAARNAQTALMADGKPHDAAAVAVAMDTTEAEAAALLEPLPRIIGLIPDTDGEPTTPGPTPDALAVHEALNALPARSRRVVRALICEGDTLRAVAAREGITVPMVKRVRESALSTLRHALAG